MVDPAEIFQPRDPSVPANAEVSKWTKYTVNGVPTWLVVTYVVSNLILNFLNYFWFSKMVETVMKRFREPAPAAPVKKTKEEEEELLRLREKVPPDAVLDAASRLQQEEGNMLSGEVDVDVRRRTRKA